MDAETPLERSKRRALEYKNQTKSANTLVSKFNDLGGVFHSMVASNGRNGLEIEFLGCVCNFKLAHSEDKIQLQRSSGTKLVDFDSDCNPVDTADMETALGFILDSSF